MPLLVWWRGRWPVDSIAFARVATRETVAAGREPAYRSARGPELHAAATHTRAERSAAATIVVLVHATLDVYATVTRIAIGRSVFINARVSSRPGAAQTLAVVDALAPAPFPPAPGTRLLLFPDADAATLLAHFERLHACAAAPMSYEQLADAMARYLSDYERWLQIAGYLAPADDAAKPRRYTLKGGFSAVLRPYWPWHALSHARLARQGREAMRAASGGVA